MRYCFFILELDYTVKQVQTGALKNAVKPL